MISINDLAGLVLGMITVAGFDDDGRSCPVVSAVEVDPAREDLDTVRADLDPM